MRVLGQTSQMSRIIRFDQRKFSWKQFANCPKKFPCRKSLKDRIFSGNRSTRRRVCHGGTGYPSSKPVQDCAWPFLLVTVRASVIMRAPPPFSCFPGKPVNGFVSAAACRAIARRRRVSAAAFSDLYNVSAPALLRCSNF